MVKLTKYGLEVQYNTPSFKERKILESNLKFYMEGSQFSVASREHGWDGFVKFYDSRRCTFDFGFLSRVVNALEEENVNWQVNGLDVETFVPKGNLNNNLWIHQKEAILKFFEVKHGILQIPTRGGKTFIASEMFRLVREVMKDCKCLFIVDTQDLFDQDIGDISKYLNVSRKQIGVIQGSNFYVKDITVAMMQTLQLISEGVKNIKSFYWTGKGESRVKKFKTLEQLREERKKKKQQLEVLQSYLSEVKFLVVDECHEHTSIKRISVIKQVDKAEFYLFLSAEPFRSEDMFGNLRLQSVAGDVFYVIPERELKDRGVLAKDKVLLILMDYKNLKIDYDKKYLDQRKQIITQNPLRNSILTNVIEICRKLSLKTLVLFNSIEHGHYIKSITRDPFISGKDALEDRKFVKNAFLRGRGKVLLASDIFKKGITLPQVEVLVNAAGGLEKANVVQKKGRVLGVTDEKKKALIIDVIDVSKKYFDEHSLSRIEVYESKVGTENIVVFDANDVDFYNDVTDFITSWFNEK